MVNIPLRFKLEKFPPEVERGLLFIKIAKKDVSISEIKRRQMYRNLYDVLLNEIKIESTISQNPTQNGISESI